MPWQILYSNMRAVTVIFWVVLPTYDESIIGSVQIMVVLFENLTSQRAFMAVPTITLVESIEAKLLPVIVML